VGGVVNDAGSTFSYNLAIGGLGITGGSGLGGGIYVAAPSTPLLGPPNSATVNLIGSTVAGNMALGAPGGQGVGGGVYNLGTFTFDVTTVIHHNHASTSNDDIYP
jgi:hypothetical protein